MIGFSQFVVVEDFVRLNTLITYRLSY